MDHSVFHARARNKGVNLPLYWLVRSIVQPFFLIYFRLSRKGRHHIPKQGPVILAANHRSFLDPFMIGACAPRPVYYVAKKELFRGRLISWFLNSLGAFPVNRGAGDAEMVKTAHGILARGDALLIFPEGTRIRKPSLGPAKRGVGRMILESGAPVVPLSVRGSGNVRTGLLIRPRKVRIEIGPPLKFPRTDNVSPQLAAAVTDQVWPRVVEHWLSLGGAPPEQTVQDLSADPNAKPLLTASFDSSNGSHTFALVDEADE